MMEEKDFEQKVEDIVSAGIDLYASLGVVVNFVEEHGADMKVLAALGKIKHAVSEYAEIRRKVDIQALYEMLNEE